MSEKLEILQTEEGNWIILDENDSVFREYNSKEQAQQSLSKLRQSKKSSTEQNDYPVTSFFLGPGAENSELLRHTINHIFNDYVHWRKNYFPTDPLLIQRSDMRNHDQWLDHFSTNLDFILRELKAHFPIFSPRYIAHMVSEQTLPSIAGYLAGLLYNPNNVSSEAAPVTVDLELEVGDLISDMLGYKKDLAWVHICSGGTIANLEAMWVARSAQIRPLLIQDFCKAENIDLPLPLPYKGSIDIKLASPRKLLSMNPSHSLDLQRDLFLHLKETKNLTEELVTKTYADFCSQSPYNVQKFGIAQVYQKLSLQPKILVPQTAHYSFLKIANLLGIGTDCIDFIPVTNKFRVNTQALEDSVFKMSNERKSDSVTMAVVAIMGSTEEGAVDPIHHIESLRTKLWQETGQSFWLHADAAWGGYIRSVLCSRDIGNTTSPALNNLDCLANSYFSIRNEQPSITIKTSGPTEECIAKKVKLGWKQPDVVKSFLALPFADSITVDPHKLGYVPYPAGVIAFKNFRVKSLLKQKADYIADFANNEYLMEFKRDNKVGPYILEGSKPGAAAASCWMAHKTIPLNRHGHGKIVEGTLENTAALYEYLNSHMDRFEIIERRYFSKPTCNPFSILPLYHPDTNLICFLVQPLLLKDGVYAKKPISLRELNRVNENIYHLFSIETTTTERHLPYLQQYFVSKTRFQIPNYSLESVKNLLADLEIDPAEFEREGLFVLRSTVMNPFYQLAHKRGKNYLSDFVDQIHLSARKVLENQP